MFLAFLLLHFYIYAKNGKPIVSIDSVLVQGPASSDVSLTHDAITTAQQLPRWPTVA